MFRLALWLIKKFVSLRADGQADGILIPRLRKAVSLYAKLNGHQESIMHDILAKYSKSNKAIFFSTMVVAFYWTIGFVLPIYKYAIVGAIFECTWLAMVLLLFILPLVSIIYLIKEKFKFKLLLWLSFFISTTLLIILISFFN